MNELGKALNRVKTICPNLRITSQEPANWMELSDFLPAVDGIVTISSRGNIVYNGNAYDSPGEGICTIGLIP